MKMPFKVAIMQHFILNPDTSFDVNEILEAMKPVYGKERQCNPVRIDYYLRAMLNVNIRICRSKTKGNDREARRSCFAVFF